MNPVVRKGTRLRSAVFKFIFDGREFTAQEGDTAASALAANGIRLLGRSVKYHRRRGLLTVGPDDPGTLFSVGNQPNIIPNVAASILELTPGIELHSQNRWPTLRFDLACVLQFAGGILSAGFYYKTFLWPSWTFYEGMIRRMAGLGPAPSGCNLRPPAVKVLDCDVLVAGAGAAGLAAARAAARAGARVILCDRDNVCGGELEFESATIEGANASEWVRSTVVELAERGVLIFDATAVIGGSDESVIALKQPGGLPGKDTQLRIRPRAFVVATGACERPLAFVDNDRPGVMLLSAGERLLAQHGVHPGRQVVIFGNHDRIYHAARRFGSAGIDVRAIVDTRTAVQSGAAAGLRLELERQGVECFRGCAVSRSFGWADVTGVEVASVAGHGSPRRIPCNAVLMSGGWSATIHAGLHEGGTSTYDTVATSFLATKQPQWRAVCGAADGALELGGTLASGHAAGVAAAQLAGVEGAAEKAPTGHGDGAPNLVPFWRAPADLRAEKRQFVDFQNDVTVADLRQALAEGFIHIEHVKRYTTLGVGTDQGRLGMVLSAGIVAELTGQAVGQIGQFRTRAPFQPATLKALAGLRAGPMLRPVRRTPLHALHVANGGVFTGMGLWTRPRFYTANGDDAFVAGCAEAKRVREHCGVCDASSLGKLEICGRDAAEFLDRLYLTRASTIKVGRARYMVNLREDGIVLDDGLVLRLGPERFLATTSSEHGAHMLSHFEFYRASEFAGRAVAVTDVTEAWAVIVCAGPGSREMFRVALGDACGGDAGRLAHMEFVAGNWHGSEVRLVRASFSGELAFEIHCRPRSAVAVWNALVAAGAAPYGLEALDILRVEKGYVVSSEMNGQTTPFDLGMERLVRLDSHSVGRPLLDRSAFHELTRPRLIGVRAADGHSKFLAGAQLVTAEARQKICGHVTSAAYSPALGEWIGLALLARDRACEGASILARDPLRNGDTVLKVTPATHFDASGDRLRA